MADVRYPQFCALARAAEVIGERWTLLIVRELLLGPKRFTDLRERLDGVSPTVLTQRLARAEAVGLVRRAALPAPAASTAYELTADGRALKPAILELIRWGERYLLPPRKGDRFEPEWARLALAACARRGPSPRRSIQVRIREAGKEASLHVAGGPKGTVVSDAAAPSEVTVATSIRTLMSLISGALPVKAALAAKRITVSGEPKALADLPRLFTFDPRHDEPPSGAHD
jgi:DNA-binding HxlR family transcriptional regulator